MTLRFLTSCFALALTSHAGFAQQPQASESVGPGPGSDLAAVRAREAARAEVIARVAPSVCSVMRMESPGGGSGVIYHPKGFILTNYHVVGEPEKDGSYRRMKIGLPDGRLYEADVLGIDPGSDLAVLLLEPREDGEPWPSSKLGFSGNVLVGEKVFAMGNPFLLATDFTPTVTFGVVSGTHRYQSGAANRMLVYPDCIQTDAPVNPGNSGGPLFAESGEVIGINGRISINMERGRVNVGVGFAIAIDQAKNFLPDLMAGRHAEHGTMDLNAWFMTSREGSKKRGVFVQSLFRDSIAAEHGVSLGDEIVSFNGVAVRSANQLATMVGVLPEKSWIVLVTRPALDDGGFGEQRESVFRLSRLDTGSSRELEAFDEGLRLATKDHRLTAADALLSVLDETTTSQGAVDAVTMVISTQGVRCAFARDGDRFAVERNEVGKPAVRIVQEADGTLFVVEGDTARDPSPEEAAFLSRHIRANPLFYYGPARRLRLKDAPLVGGVLVFGRAAARFEIPREKGEPVLETWFYLDGEPAGWSIRDPLARESVAFRLAHPDFKSVSQTLPDDSQPALRVERGDTLDLKVSLEGPVIEAAPESMFVRPGS